MEASIIVDSGCDMPEQMKKEMSVAVVPLTLMLGQTEFVDDESLDLAEFMKTMKECSEKVGSASPSPYLYQKAIQSTGGEYVITLSGKLSGSYSNAVLGSSQAEEDSGQSAHVFDSKSASAGETLIAIKLHELIREGLAKTRIIEAVHDFIDNMKTYFVLENYENLQKNGRLSKVAGSLIQILNIKLIMGSDGNGNIVLYEKVRGMRQMLERLMSLVENSGKKTEGENLVISHCNNLELAEQLCTEIKKRFKFKNIHIVPTGGLSSLYAAEKGIVIAF
ncbi:MAG TPA: DegV family protein [Clostridiales bacterium]|nr:DegV family protein [Clostridiales bacterium]